MAEQELDWVYETYHHGMVDSSQILHRPPDIKVGDHIRFYDTKGNEVVDVVRAVNFKWDLNTERAKPHGR